MRHNHGGRAEAANVLKTCHRTTPRTVPGTIQRKRHKRSRTSHHEERFMDMDVRYRKRAPVSAMSTAAGMWIIARSVASAAEMTTDYLKPTVSSKDCVNTVGQIATKTESMGNDGACMQCDPAKNVCPPGCQALIDQLYVNCDGITTPDGLFYDPSNAIEGTWSDQVKARIKIATERCGCDSALRIKPVGSRALVVGGVSLCWILSIVVAGQLFL